MYLLAKRIALGGATLFAASANAVAGMPAPIPEPDELVRVFRLNETADQRLQVISFFVAGLLLCAAIVRWLWNGVARELPLPRLSFGKSLGAVVLWGLLFVIVLTMISGARELMTPGAWKKQGFTYQLADGADAALDPDPATLRRRHLEQLRQSLWHFAATHQGRFPSDDERTAIAADLWIVPESGGMRYQYIPGLRAEAGNTPLVIAPATDSGRNLALLTDGSIVFVPAVEGPTDEGGR